MAFRLFPPLPLQTVQGVRFLTDAKEPPLSVPQEALFGRLVSGVARSVASFVGGSREPFGLDCTKTPLETAGRAGGIFFLIFWASPLFKNALWAPR